MARPKKTDKLNEVLILHQQGLSSRKIAERINFALGYRTIQNIIKEAGQKLGKNPSNVDNPMLGKNWAKTGQKPPTSEKPTCGYKLPLINHVESSPTWENASPPSSTTRPFASIHRFWLSVAYSGAQPSFGRLIPYKNNVYYRSETEDYTLEAHKHRLKIWIHGVKGSDSSDIKAKARGKARSALALVASQNALSLDWATFKEIPEPEYVLESGPLNDALMDELGPKRKESEMKLGLIPGDSTDPDNVEAHGKPGEVSLDGLYWLTKDFPDQFASFARGLKEYNENLKLHLEVMRDIRDLVKELRMVKK